jgi:TfoX/Sxy family transcriptional regulator of competence genes
MTVENGLVDRVRHALATRTAVREVRMFGGLSFMVDEKLAVCVRGDGDLLVRADPERADELLALEGAQPAEMGAGRSMGPSWISVTGPALSSDDGLAFWLRVALEHNATATATPPRRGRQRRPSR